MTSLKQYSRFDEWNKVLAMVNKDLLTCRNNMEKFLALELLRRSLSSNQYSINIYRHRETPRDIKTSQQEQK